eukprot:scaffold203190_cov27-Tisochrysis_lutea.AAC.4
MGSARGEGSGAGAGACADELLEVFESGDGGTDAGVGALFSVASRCVSCATLATGSRTLQSRENSARLRRPLPSASTLFSVVAAS